MNVPTHIILPNKSSPVPLRHAKSIDVNVDSDVFSVKDQATSPFLPRSPLPHPLSHQLPSNKPLQKTDVKEQAAADENMISNKSSSSSYTFTFKAAEASSDVSLAVKKPRFRGCRGGRKQRLRKQREAIRRNNNHAAMASSSSSSSSHESSSSTFSNASSDKTKTTVRPSQSMKSAAVATSGDASSRKNESSIASSLSHKLTSSTTTRSDVSSDTKGALLNAKKKKATIRLRPSQRKKTAATNTSASTSTITTTTNNNNNKKKKPIVKLSNEEALCLFAAVVVKEKNVDSISPLAPRCCLHILDEDAAKNAESLNEFMCRVSFADGSTKDVEVKSSELVGFVSFLLECDKTWVFHIKLQSSDAWSIVSPNDILQHVQFLVHYAVRDLRDTHKMRKPWQREWIFLDNDLMYY